MCLLALFVEFSLLPLVTLSPPQSPVVPLILSESPLVPCRVSSPPRNTLWVPSKYSKSKWNRVSWEGTQKHRRSEREDRLVRKKKPLPRPTDTFGGIVVEVTCVVGDTEVINQAEVWFHKEEPAMFLAGTREEAKVSDKPCRPIRRRKRWNRHVVLS